MSSFLHVDSFIKIFRCTTKTYRSTKDFATRNKSEHDKCFFLMMQKTVVVSMGEKREKGDQRDKTRNRETRRKRGENKRRYYKRKWVYRRLSTCTSMSVNLYSFNSCFILTANVGVNFWHVASVSHLRSYSLELNVSCT